MPHWQAARGELLNGALRASRRPLSLYVHLPFAPGLSRLATFEADGLVRGVTAGMIEITSIGRVFIRTIAQVFDAFQPAAVASRAV